MTNTQPTPIAEVSAEMLRRQEVCPLCEGKQMEPGFFCIAHCRAGVVLWTTANTLRNIKPWLEGDKQRRTALADAERKLEDICASLECAAGCDEGVAEDQAYSEILSWGGSAVASSYASARTFLAQDGGKA